MDVGDAEGFAPKALAFPVEAIRDGLHAHGDTLGPEVHAVDPPHKRRLGVSDHQHFLDAVPSLASLLRRVTVRRRRAVPMSLARVLLHGAKGVLGVFPALVFVEHGQHLA
ncbi:hypothetical protein AAFN86_00880 [Roseomonas sp. CAU 1739]